MNSTEYDISQEDVSFGGQDDYLHFEKTKGEKEAKYKNMINNITEYTCNDVIVAIAEYILKENGPNHMVHRVICKPLFKILQDRKLTKVLEDVVADELNGTWSYFIPNNWGTICNKCQDFSLFDGDPKNPEIFVCMKCSRLYN